jgi:hypothetical protein
LLLQTARLNRPLNPYLPQKNAYGVVNLAEASRVVNAP